jgi:hypothetical protein
LRGGGGGRQLLLESSEQGGGGRRRGVGGVEGEVEVGLVVEVVEKGLYGGGGEEG